MTPTDVNPARHDPYKNFRFRVLWNGRCVAGMSQVSALRRGTDVVKHRDGGDPSTGTKSPGRPSFEAIRLERGVTHDPEFQAWVGAGVRDGAAPGPGTPPKGSRMDLGIEWVDDAGHPVATYRVRGCWVSAYQALPDLDGQADAVAIELIRLENEGWEREVPDVEDGFVPE